MKSILLIIITVLPLLSIGQTITCDTATIFATNGTNAFCFEVVNNVRYCFSNNYPDHSDNYNQPQFTLSEDDEEYSMCAYPDTSSWFTPLYEKTETTVGCTDIYIFGVLLNGVRLDPSSGDVFVRANGTNNQQWHVEATSTTNSIGVNMGTLNGGHLNPFGDYHYHATPTDYFVNDLNIDGTAHSPIVGYAADGFPIYYKYVYQDATDATSAITTLSSGYSLKSGTRPGNGSSSPDGTYDGEYYEDYEYTTTTLDSCNGRFAVTPDYPYGTYYYVLTDNYPYIPRCFKGTELDPTYRIGPGAACPASTASSDCAAAVSGCMDPFANNYNANANIDNGSCTYTAVPVELMSFSGEKQHENILLRWETATEINNDYFEVEFSLDGLNFEKIGQVKGAGTTIENQSYEFLHDLNRVGFENRHGLYYRLKQVDFDKKYEYTNIILITIQQSNKVAINIFPNPTSDFINIEINENQIGETVQIIDILGKTLQEFQLQVTSNQREITNLPAGTYFVRVGKEVKKMVITK